MQGNNRRGPVGPVARSAAAVLVVVALVLTTTHLALRRPGLGVLDAFAAAAAVSYDRFLGELSPLSDSYISRVLGIEPSAERGRRPAAGAPGATSPVSGPMPDRSAVSGDEPAVAIELRHAFSNDDFGDALLAERLPFVARTDTTDASRQSGEPTSCAPVGGTAWYAYRPTRPVTLAADTFGTSYTSTLGVFRGSALHALEQVGCSRGVTGNASVSFRGAPGQTYWFQVTGPAGGGALAFALTALGPTTRVSVSSDERQSDGYQHEVSGLSADGRYVVFSGWAPSLGSRSCGSVGDQHTWCHALFMRDRVTGTTELLLHASERRPNTKDEESRQAFGMTCCSYWHLVPKMSRDGRYIAFHSDDPTLVPGDDNGLDDVFVLDRLTRQVERVSVSSTGQQATLDRANDDRVVVVAGSYGASMSDDGRFVVFSSAAEGLVPGDTNHEEDVFVRDRLKGTTERVSVATGGAQLDGWSTSSLLQTISGDGRYVVFTSTAPSIAPGRRPGPCNADSCTGNVFLHDRLMRTTTLLDRTVDGTAANGPSHLPTISSDGRSVAFTSLASDLVRGDTNEVADVFWRDLRTGRTQRASVNSAGEQQLTPAAGTGDQARLSATLRPHISLSADGRYLAFSSAAGNLVSGDENNAFDVFVHDARTRSTARLSVTEDGGDPNGDSFDPQLSADGRSVVFQSAADNLVSGDTNGRNDSFVHDSHVPGRT